ncbi:MAG: hypothetical protein AW07_01305 [Candidatus Accumulibacter sp. SK-11]|nr:MAG: hypothetical protein AW07_01305 [Candidatus Accumulibacter sp. SK-11]
MWRVVDQVLHVRDAGDQIDDLRRGLAREICCVADDALEDAAVAGVVIAPPADDEAAIAERDHCRLLVAGGTRTVELQFAVHPVAHGVVLLRQHPMAAAVVVPRDHEAAVGQGGHLGRVLPVVIGVVDPEFGGSGATIVVEQARIDAVDGAVLTA